MKVRWLVAGLAALAAIVALIRWIPDVAPDGDLAVIDIYALHVLGPGLHVGAYSRYGWNHPGPLYFELLAPLYWLTGARHLAVLVTAAAINAASIGVIVLLLFRRNASLACAVFVLLAAYAIRMTGLLASSWNPHVAELPFAGLVVTAAATAAGSAALLPLVVLLATFVVQAHVSYAPLAAIALLVAATSLRLRSARRPLVVAMAVGIALWSLPVLDQVSSTGTHNLSQIVQFARASAPANPTAAGRLFQRLTLAPFISDASLWNPAPPSAPDRQIERLSRFQVGALLIAGVIWLGRRRSFETILVLTIFLMGAAGSWASGRTPEPVPQAHTMLWASILGALGWAAVAGLILEVALRQKRIPARLKWAAIGATSALCVWHVAVVRSDELTRSDRSFTLSHAVTSYLNARQIDDVLVHIPQDYWGVATGTVLQLYRAGITTHVDAGWVSMFGTSMTPSGTERATIQFATAAERAADFDHRTTHQLLGGSGDHFVFAVAPDPPSSAAATLEVVAASNGVEGAARLGDGVVSAAGPASPATVGFVGTSASVIVALPPGAIGVSLSGQPSSVWQLQCRTGESTRPVGQVRLEDGAETTTGRAFLRDLAGCQHLQVSPTTDGVLSWLAEMEVLVSSSPHPL